MFRWLLEDLGNPSTSLSLKKGMISMQKDAHAALSLNELLVAFSILANGAHFSSWNKRRLKASKGTGAEALI